MECSICLDPLQAHVVKLECSHEFHQECILEYIKTKKTDVECPLCRQRLCVPRPSPIYVEVQAIEVRANRKKYMTVAAILLTTFWCGMFLYFILKHRDPQ